MSPATTDLFVDVRPGDSGKRIVFIHGGMDRHTSFGRVRKLLDAHTTLAYDRRGYARSLDAGPAVSLQGHVDDVLAIVGTDPATVVGHSYGGVVGLCAAAQRPELVTGLVVYEAPMPWTDWWPTIAADSSDMARLEANPEEAAEWFMRRVAGDRVWELLGDKARSARRAEGSALLIDVVGLRVRTCPYDVTKIECPVMIGFGTKSHDHDIRSAHELAILFDQREEHDRQNPVSLVELSASSHNAPTSTPEAFADLIRSVL